MRFLGAAIGIVLTALCGCQDRMDAGATMRCGQSAGDTDRVVLPIYGGSPACESLGAWSAAVGYLLVSTTVDSRVLVTGCTVSRIGRGVAITAKHCFPQDRDYAAVVGFGAAVADVTGCGDGNGETTVLDVTIHPVADLALIRFAESSGGPSLRLGSTPAPIDSAVVLSGFGLTESGAMGHRRCIDSRIVQSGSMLVTSSDEGDKGACTGDSGGGLLRLVETGGPELIGALHGGSASCVGRDQYTPLLTYVDWITNEKEAW